jgi:hypothetical protein
MSRERINGEQPSTVEWGGGAGDRLDWLATDRPVVRGAGIGCAVAGFGLLLAAQLLPWMSVTTSPLQQDFPTATGGRVDTGLAQLQVPHEMFNLGWLALLAVVATALVVRPPVRRLLVAAGLGLTAGQIALLAGITYAIKHNTSPLFRGGLVLQPDSSALGFGLYCAYAAIGLCMLALLLAGGVPARLRDHEPAADHQDADLRGPVDLTVSPLPSADPAVWSRHDPDIDSTRRQPGR